MRRIATDHAQVWCTQGIHPHEADSWSDELSKRITENCSSTKVVAIGEIGLDYHYDHADRRTQAEAFDAQLNIASEAGLPVVIHTREADEDTRAILANHSQTLKNKGVIHSFTSSLSLAEFCLSEGFMLGFNGIITFRNAENVREVAEPRYLPFIAETLAGIKKLDTEVFLEHARRNSYQLFF